MIYKQKNDTSFLAKELFIQIADLNNDFIKSVTA